METTIYFVCKKEHLEKLRETTPEVNVTSEQTWICGHLRGVTDARKWIHLIALTGTYRNEINMFDRDGKRISTDQITFDDVMQRFPESNTEEIKELLKTICKSRQISLKNKTGLFAFNSTVNLAT